MSDQKASILSKTKLVWLICSLLLIVAPVSFAQGRWVGLAFGMGVGFLNALGSRRNFVQGVFAGLVAGLTTGLAFSFTEGLLVGLLASFASGFATTISTETEIDRSRLFGAVIIGFLLGLTMGLGLLYSKGFREALPVMAVMTFTATLGVPFGIILGYWLRPKLLLFADIWLYLREMATYLVGFAFGYFAIAMLFASWFWSIWKIYPSDSFGNLSSNPTFGEFFYFSVVTIATLGYGDIIPKSAAARALVVSEVVLGIGWITIVFAAVLSHLQPRFAEIANRRRGEQLKEMEDKQKEFGIPSIYTIMVSSSEDDGKGVYATIRNDYAKNNKGKPIYGKEYGFWMWGPRLRGTPPQKAGFGTSKEAEETARRMYKELNLE